MLNFESCNLCPRCCGVNRASKRGFCSASGETVRVGRAMLHMWEEPCISGQRGSGTIFFVGCNLKCIYCQNSVLSNGDAGIDIPIEKLAETMLYLQCEGAHNINLVTPTHYSLQIISAVRLARQKGLQIPIVYNTSGYESVEAINALSKTVDVYLTDFKYSDNLLAGKYSGVSDYFEVALDALTVMVKQVGSPRFDDNGIMEKGVIVRHLVLPGHIENSKKVLSEIYQRFGNKIFVSIMNQYTPIKQLPFPELNRTVTAEEYDAVIDYALDLGMTQAFVQDGETQSESFIPEFNGEGIV